MPNLNIGNDVVDTCEAKKLINQNIKFFQTKITGLKMNSRTDLRLLSFYATKIKDQELLLEWIIKAEQRAENTQAA